MGPLRTYRGAGYFLLNLGRPTAIIPRARACFLIKLVVDPGSTGKPGLFPIPRANNNNWILDGFSGLGDLSSLWGRQPLPGGLSQLRLG